MVRKEWVLQLKLCHMITISGDFYLMLLKFSFLRNKFPTILIRDTRCWEPLQKFYKNCFKNENWFVQKVLQKLFNILDKSISDPLSWNIIGNRIQVVLVYKKCFKNENLFVLIQVDYDYCNLTDRVLVGSTRVRYKMLSKSKLIMTSVGEKLPRSGVFFPALVIINNICCEPTLTPSRHPLWANMSF